MQAVFQAHVDAGVSKTVNLRPDATVDDVLDVFLLARKLRLKGITVYRYGSHADQVLSLPHGASGRECRECAV
jgi:ribonucleoside-diphosphate reductase alpha chain